MPTTISGNTGVSQVQADATQGSLPLFGCRAWVNFAGTKDTTGATSTANTNRLINASGNVTSVLRNGTGDYTVTFTEAPPDANYAAVVTSNAAQGLVGTLSTSTINVITTNSAGSSADASIVSVAIFR